ncbi:MAG: flagellar hook-associated protein FlgL [Clostridiaceae bacterium]|nr:flagellar hook-associated protein FlgL [Clostridiaceae bacterium]
MRVTNTMITNNLMRNLNRNLSRMEKLQQQMASGKQFTRPSDDPIGVSRSLRLNTEVATMEQYKRNADDTQSWLDTTEMAINNIVTILHRANELTVQAANDTNSTGERNAIAGEIKELRDQLVQIGNTSYAGSYIFSGFKTDKPLFDANGEYDLGGGAARLTLDEVIETNIGLGDRMGMNTLGQRLFGLYNGVDVGDLDLLTVDTLKQQQSMKGKYITPADPLTVAVDFTLTNGTDTADITIAQTFDGATASDNLTALAAEITDQLVGTDLEDPHVIVSIKDNRLVFESDNEMTFQSASSASDLAVIGMTNSQASVSRINSGDEPQLIAVFDQLILDLTSGNTLEINNAIGRIQTQANNISAIRAEIGVKSNRIELTTNRILDDTLNLQGLLSKNEDADMAEVIMKIQMEENVYNASLSTGARIIQPSLIDFLR